MTPSLNRVLFILLALTGIALGQDEYSDPQNKPGRYKGTFTIRTSLYGENGDISPSVTKVIPTVAVYSGTRWQFVTPELVPIADRFVKTTFFGYFSNITNTRILYLASGTSADCALTNRKSRLTYYEGSSSFSESTPRDSGGYAHKDITLRLTRIGN